MVTGTNMAYVAGDGHRPLPMATDLLYRKAHAPVVRKPAGLDWDALTPRCTVCGGRSTQLNNADTCPPCAGPVTAPATPAPKKPKKAPVRRPAVARTPKAPKAPRQPHTGRRAPQPSTNIVEIRRLYVEERLSISKVAETTGHVRGTVRRVLLDAGIKLRDDRTTNSGGRNRITEYPPDLVAEVRRLYVDEGMTQSEVAQQVGTNQKSISTLMARTGIPARPAACSPGSQVGRPNPIESLRTRIEDLGTTAREVKEWAIREGLLLGMQVGVPPARLVDAYVAAHPRTEDPS